MTMIERVGWAIANVALWSRFNDWTSDRVEGFPIEICRYGDDDEPEIVVVRRFPRDIGEVQALTMTVMEERAKAAIEAMREPTDAMKDVWWPNTDVGHYQAMIDAALQEGKGAA